VLPLCRRRLNLDGARIIRRLQNITELGLGGAAAHHGPLLNGAAATASFRRGREQWGGERGSSSTRRSTRHSKPRQLGPPTKGPISAARRTSTSTGASGIVQPAITNAVRPPSSGRVFRLAAILQRRRQGAIRPAVDSEQSLHVSNRCPVAAAAAASSTSPCIISDHRDSSRPGSQLLQPSASATVAVACTPGLLRNRPS
jgi:hypothetical protein